jgi:hypothetical protein
MLIPSTIHISLTYYWKIDNFYDLNILSIIIFLINYCLLNDYKKIRNKHKTQNYSDDSGESCSG